MATETLYANAQYSGTVSTPENAYGAADGTFTTDSGNVSWTNTWSMGDPVGVLPNGTHTFVLRVRKYPGTGTPVINSVTFVEGGTNRVGKSIAQNVTSLSGQDVTIQLTEAEMRLISNLAVCEVMIQTTGAGGSPGARAAVQVDSITWSGDFSAAVKETKFLPLL